MAYQKRKQKQKSDDQNKIVKPASDAEALAFVESVRKSGHLGDIKKKIDFISTGSWVINRLIGDGTQQNRPGGIPRGYVTEIFGDEGCGKTTLGLHIAKEALSAGGRVIYADYEKTLRMQFKYIENIGLDTSPPNFLHLEPDNFEDGVKMIGLAMMKLSPVVVIVDTVTAMLPKATFEGEADQSVQVGQHAKLTGTWLNWMTKRLGRRNCALVLINQMRSTIKTDMYDTGPKEVTSGGRGIRFFSSIRIHMKPGQREQVEEISDITGVSEKKSISQTVKVVIAKNKMDMPFKSGPIYIQFGHGIDNIMSLAELAVNRRIIKKEGAWFSWKDAESNMEFKIQGKQALKKHLESNPEILEVLKPKLAPNRDEVEINEMMRVLEAKGVDKLSTDEKEDLLALRKAKGLPVEDIELSSSDAEELKELEDSMGGGKQGEKRGRGVVQ